MTQHSEGVRLCLLGEFRLAEPNGCVRTLPTRKAIWLLAILGLNRGTPMAREAVAGWLWPDSDYATSLHNLRQLLNSVRKSLGESATILSAPSKDTISLTEDVWVDALEFERIAASSEISELELAAELYRGPLLPVCVDDYATQHRSRLAEIFLRVADCLSTHYVDTGRYLEAIQTLNRSLEIDDLREATYIALIRAHAKAGSAVKAMELYRSLRRKLRERLDLEPSLAIQVEIDAIRLDQVAARTQHRSGLAFQSGEPLVGRRNDLKTVTALLLRCRLVTLVGVGGIGKTRLAIAGAETVRKRLLDGITFVDLSQIISGDHVLSTVAKAFSFSEQPGTSQLESLVSRLARLEVLLVLDNCEHVLESASALIERLLLDCPEVRILATSRQATGVVGECAWRVPPLSLPFEASRGVQLKSSGAVKLFLKLSSPPVLDEAHLLCIAKICALVDGLPLGIELAAASNRLLTVFEIRERLESCKELVARATNRPSRHQSLDSAVSWSWDLLNAREREALGSVALFRGGATLPALLFMHPDVSEETMLKLLTNLTDRSLVSSSPSEFGSRFTTLETIRQFAERKLRQEHRSAPLKRRHRDFCLQYAEGAQIGASSPTEAEWFRRFELELDNFRVAIDWSLRSKHILEACRFAKALARFWDTYGNLSEGRLLLTTILRQVTNDVPQPLAGQLQINAGWMAFAQRDIHAALGHFTCALDVFQASGERRLSGHIHNGLASVYLLAGSYEEAEAHYMTALEITRELQHPTGLATVLNNLGELEIVRGNYVAARNYLTDALIVNSPGRESHGQILCNLGMLECLEKNYEQAKQQASCALEIFNDAAVPVNNPVAIALIGVAEAGLGNAQQASRFFESAARSADLHGVTLPALVQSMIEEIRP